MGMRSIVDTIKQIDENCKKIVFKHFDEKNVSNLHNNIPLLLKKLSKIVKQAEKIKSFSNEIIDEDYESLDSGNLSDKDQINIIERKKIKCQLDGIDEVSTSSDNEESDKVNNQ